MQTKLTEIPGIGKTFEQDFARIGLTTVEQFKDLKAEEVFDELEVKNNLLNHKTSKLYLYVIRMIIYYANGGRDAEKLKWNYWKAASNKIRLIV